MRHEVARPERGRYVGWIVLALLAGIAGSLQARTLTLAADRVEQADLQASTLQLTLDEDAGGKTLSLRVARLEAPSLAIAGALDWDCTLTATDRSTWTCAGPVQFPGTAGSRIKAHLAATVHADRIELDVKRDKARVLVRLPFATAPVHAAVTNLPLTWLNEPLQTAWKEGSFGAGSADAQIDFADNRIAGSYNLAGAAFDSVDGSIAGSGIAVSGTLELRNLETAPRIRLGATLRAGEVLMGPIYTKLPASPTQLDLDVQALPNGRWDVENLSWRDPGVLEFSAKAQLAPAEADWLPQADIKVGRIALPAALDRYARSWLSTLGFADLAATGSAQGGLGFDRGGWSRLAFSTSGLDVSDGAGRFALSGLEGGVDWSAQGSRGATRLDWKSARLYGMDLSGADAALRSRDGLLAIDQPVDVGLLGGHLLINSLTLHPRAGPGERFGAGIALTDIAVPQLSRALGWPEFGGTLAGAIPHIGFDGDVLKLDGGLMMQVFDGTLNVTALSLERPFGVAPSLGADIAFKGLDLKLLTGAFSFGQITGRLDGYVRALRLLDWKPIAFDAALHADSGGRISQRAVSSLSSVGGAGIAGGIQASLLKMFQTFGYARLGLSCRMADNICHMSGLDSANGGYTIVNGSGLPRITIVGFAREVDWPTLVDRLKAATEGQAPIIQ